MKGTVLTAYIMTILISSTTPLGIVWSSESVHPSMAVLLRMLIAAILGLAIIVIRKIEFPRNPTAYKLYAYSGIGIFGGLLLTYMSASYLPSGTISLIFGLSPIISSLLASRILGEERFTPVRKVAITTALFGLSLVCFDSLGFSPNSLLGLIYLLIAVFFFCLSGVLVKSVKIVIHPLSTTVGALIITLPFFAVTWYLMDGTLVISEWQPRSVWAIIYLGVFGSLIGFVSYFYILQKLPASTVALVTLMTPITAVIIGVVFNGEIITLKLALGALLVMLGLGLFLFGNRLRYKVFHKS